mmetsp:Transcript_3613/g.6720  ORF Transcript_3613/g.6720 Transcript_3613/m.6720 type:complete len:108 (-) Transcript_3613:2224-2547(-)
MQQQQQQQQAALQRQGSIQAPTYMGPNAQGNMSPMRQMGHMPYGHARPAPMSQWGNHGPAMDPRVYREPSITASSYGHMHRSGMGYSSGWDAYPVRQRMGSYRHSGY